MPSAKLPDSSGIECKMRAVEGLLGKTKDDGAAPNSDPTAQLTKHINGALEKPATDDRIIFVDVNAEPTEHGVAPVWTQKAARRLDMKDKDLKDGQAAYVFITNFPFHRALHSDQPGHMLMTYGLGIPDFGKEGMIRLRDMFRGRQKHADAYDIIAAFEKYPQIPPTFDGSLPSSLTGKSYDRIVIGETYHFTDIGENGIIGTVTSATVNEAAKQMIIAVTTDGKVTNLLTQPMSDEALLDYKSHPEAFFGIIQHVGKNTTDPYELFIFFHDTYKQSSKEKLLEFMVGAADMPYLKTLSQEDLAIEYCERMVAMHVSRFPK